MNKITIKDVAKEAGVSPATVSRYNTGKYKLLSNENFIKISKALRNLNYTPNKNAQILGRKRKF